MAEETSDILQEYQSLVKNREFGSKTWVDDFFKKNHLLAGQSICRHRHHHHHNNNNNNNKKKNNNNDDDDNNSNINNNNNNNNKITTIIIITSLCVFDNEIFEIIFRTKAQKHVCLQFSIEDLL